MVGVVLLLLVVVVELWLSWGFDTPGFLSLADQCHSNKRKFSTHPREAVMQFSQVWHSLAAACSFFFSLRNTITAQTTLLSFYLVRLLVFHITSLIGYSIPTGEILGTTC